MTLVNDPKAGLQQLATEPAALQGDVDTKPRQIPVRIRRMCCVHLAKDGKHVVMLTRCYATGEHGSNGVAVRLDARWQPEGDGGELAKSPNGPFPESPPPKAPRNLGKSARYCSDSG